MKRLNIFYWVCTGLLIPGVGIGSVSELLGNEKSVEIVTSLGYPAYLSPFLAVARLLALLVIFVPKFSRLKEWAYAGLAFDLIGAIYSLLAVGNPFAYVIIPAIILALLFSSYILHHKRQQLHIANRVGVQYN